MAEARQALATSATRSVALSRLVAIFVQAELESIDESHESLSDPHAFNSDKEAETFVATADLTQYDLSDMRPLQYEFQPKSQRVTMRLPVLLVEASSRKQLAWEYPTSVTFGRYWKRLCITGVKRARQS